MTLKQKHTFIYISLSIIAIGLATIFYMKFLDGVYINKPLTIIEPTEIRTVKDTYKKGETVQALIEYCKNDDKEGTVQWNIVDGFLVNYATRVVTFPSGCHKVVTNLEMIPDFFVGEHNVHFQGTINYSINALKTISIPIRTTNFKVIQ